LVLLAAYKLMFPPPSFPGTSAQSRSAGQLAAPHEMLLLQGHYSPENKGWVIP